MTYSRITFCLVAALMFAPLSTAFGEAPYRHARQVSYGDGCSSCGVGVPCAAPCGDCCDPCTPCCVPIIPAVLNRIDCALQRIFSLRCYDPCACGLNCYECAGCSGGFDGGCSSCGGGDYAPEMIGGQLSPLPRAARAPQTSPRTSVTRGVSTPQRAAAAPKKQQRATGTPTPARVKTA